MAGTERTQGAVNVRLRCSSWSQLLGVYRRDLSRGVLFLKSEQPPPPGTAVAIRLMLPSGGAVDLAGTVESAVGREGAGPRGPGASVVLDPLPAESQMVLTSAVQVATEHYERRAPQAPAAPAPREEAGEALSSDEGEPLLEAEDELIESLEGELETLLRFNRFQVLGIGYAADGDEVRAAFAELSKRYHPDRYLRYHNPRIAELAEGLFVTAREAYQTLLDPGRREEERDKIRGSRKGPPPRLLRDLARARTSGGEEPEPEPEPAEPEPEPAEPEPEPAEPEPDPAEPGAGEPPPEELRDPLEVFPEARVFVEAGDYGQAVDFFFRAARDRPGDPTARVGLDLALGLRALEAGDRVEAADRLTLVLERHPENERAARELAALRRLSSRLRQAHLAQLHKDVEGS